VARAPGATGAPSPRQRRGEKESTMKTTMKEEEESTMKSTMKDLDGRMYGMLDEDLPGLVRDVVMSLQDVRNYCTLAELRMRLLDLKADAALVGEAAVTFLGLLDEYEALDRKAV
jgi:hypothetical protein